MARSIPVLIILACLAAAAGAHVSVPPQESWLEQADRLDTLAPMDPAFQPAFDVLSDLTPLVGTTWNVEFTIISTFTDTFTFGDQIQYLDATPYLTVKDKYGNIGSCFPKWFAWQEHDYGVVFINEWWSPIETEFYDFNISGNTLNGVYQFKYDGNQYSNPYPLTGVRVGGPPPPAPTPAPEPPAPPEDPPAEPAPTPVPPGITAAKSGIWKSHDHVLSLYLQRYPSGSCALIVTMGDGDYTAFLDTNYADGIACSDVDGRGYTLSLALEDGARGTLTVTLPVYGLVITPVVLVFEALGE